MKTIKAGIVTFVLLVFFLPFCQSQSIYYRSRIRPVVKEKLDSLYPKAVVTDLFESDSLQAMQINCHCEETVGMIILVFDTNGNLQRKEAHYYGSLNGLPDTILNYIKKNESPTVKFDKKEMIKYYDNTGEISYGIYLNQYILKFKSNGEFISKEAISGMEL